MSSNGMHTGTKIVLGAVCVAVALAIIVIANTSRPHPDVAVVNMLHDVQAHKYTANKIIDYFVKGKGKGKTYNDLAYFVDTFGPRISGSKNLEDAIDFMLKSLKDAHLDNVHGETAMVPHWVRGHESLELLEPRPHKMNMLGLGGSVATPEEGITAEAIVVHDFDELHGRSVNEVKGKIVIFNMVYEGYGKSVQYRYNAATEVAKLGGLAALVRSITPFSINSPHTGWSRYQDGLKKIPTACITVEDAAMLDRMQARGHRLKVTLKMGGIRHPDTVSRNTVAEIRGWKYPEQVVLISGHMDSWDVGQGAMDDGAGAFIGFEALRAIRALGLRPKRTLRAVGWTAEEVGMVGALQYYKDHKKYVGNYSLVAESDIGTFRPTGLKYKGGPKARAVMKELVKLLAPVDANSLEPTTDGGDVDEFTKAGVPGALLNNDRTKYFWFHHTDGDTMSVLDPDTLDKCAAVWTVMGYVIADLEQRLPHEKPKDQL